MRKNLFYLFALFCSLSLFTACSSDDEKLPIDEVNATFTSTDDTNLLQLTYSGEPMLGKSVTFNTTNGKAATLVLKGTSVALRSTGISEVATPGVIPGETTTTLNVTLAPLAGKNGYTFEGTDETNNRTIEYTGTVEKGKLTLSLNVTMSNVLIGIWNLSSYDPFGTTVPLRLTWESSTKFKLDLFGLGIPMEMHPGNLLSVMAAVRMIDGEKMNAHEAISAVLKNVTFRTDGNIQASYSDASNLAAPQWKASPLNIAQYYVQGNKVYLQLNLDAIFAAVAVNRNSTRIDVASILPQLMELLPLLSNGIPLEYSKDDAKGTLGVYIEKEFGMRLVNILLPLLEDEEFVASIIEAANSDPAFAAYAGITEDILKQLPEVVAGTTKMELGLNLVKVQ